MRARCWRWPDGPPQPPIPLRAGDRLGAGRHRPAYAHGRCFVVGWHGICGRLRPPCPSRTSARGAGRVRSRRGPVARLARPGRPGGPVLGGDRPYPRSPWVCALGGVADLPSGSSRRPHWRRSHQARRFGEPRAGSRRCRAEGSGRPGEGASAVAGEAQASRRGLVPRPLPRGRVLDGGARFVGAGRPTGCGHKASTS